MRRSLRASDKRIYTIRTWSISAKIKLWAPAFGWWQRIADFRPDRIKAIAATAWRCRPEASSPGYSAGTFASGRDEAGATPRKRANYGSRGRMRQAVTDQEMPDQCGWRTCHPGALTGPLLRQ